MDNEIMVSISCITFNHENFIAEALDSLIMQRTKFNYEILIHDDASTDGTAEIIKSYVERYPDLLKPIYQTENQYSKGLRVSTFNLKRAKGKYIAFCEGDDYWTDPFKLQTQVDYMEEHPECSMCVHAAYNVFPDNRKMKCCTRPNHGNKIFTTEEVIEGGGSLFATNSILYPIEFALFRPSYYYKAPVGDYPLAIYLATQGTVYYMDEFMSAYRMGVAGSWSSNLASSIDKLVKHYRDIDTMLDEVNVATNYKYNRSIINTKRSNRFKVLLDQGRYKELKTSEYKGLYDKLGTGSKVKIFIKQHLPWLAPWLKSIKRKMVHG